MLGTSAIFPLPAPPSDGDLGTLPASQVQSEEIQHIVEEAKQTKSAPTSVSTHTKTIGIIHPPPDIRNIVDKTAHFVAKNGAEFEKRIIEFAGGAVSTSNMNVTVVPLHRFFFVHMAPFIILFVLMFPHVESMRANDTDHLSLLAFKSAISGYGPSTFSSWNDSLHFCQWQGVTCGVRHKRVTILDLQSRSLAGTMSPHLGNLSFLREIRLENNSLGGPIPEEIGRLFRLRYLNLNNNSLQGEIPGNISQCSKLTFLAFGYNNLSGKIPDEFRFMVNLQTFVLHQNKLLSGSIPALIGNLTSLVVLSASNNNFNGSIPDAFRQLKKLSILALGGNHLSGMIPPSIYNLSSLLVLSLSNNHLEGMLQPGLGLMLPHLQTLQIWGNQFSGPLPVSISNCSDLEWLEAQDNNFNGKIGINFGGLNNLWRVTLFHNSFGSGEPDEMKFIDSMANCSRLNALGIQENQLNGVVPDSLGNLSAQLSFLMLSDNQFYGSLPTAIGNFVNLNLLLLNGNQFTGTIPSTIGNLLNIQRLRLFGNNFSGKIPDSVGNLSFVSELDMGLNRLEGTIPPSLGNCHSLSLLALDHNNLNGSIPREIFGLSSLTMVLTLTNNHLSGSLPPEIGKLTNLMEMDLSENELTGEIPPSIRSCTNFLNLYLQENNFRGSIPPSLDSLTGIQILNLSHNNFSGQIPRFLEKFNLTELNLSYNSFEGEVPMGGVFTNSSAISIEGNNRLCGGMPELKLPKCVVTSKPNKGHKRHLVLIIVIPIVCTLMGVVLVSLFLFYRETKKARMQQSGLSFKEPFFKVSYEQLLKATDGFSPENLIGVGSFGSVYKGILDKEMNVAIKVLNLQHHGASKSFLVECEALRNIRHRNLVKIITACSSIDFQGNDFKALVYDLMPNGSLDRWLHLSSDTSIEQDKQPKLSLSQRLSIALDVACAVEYLHKECETPIIHCDLKPSNILLDADMVAHVGDFGLSKFLVPELMNTSQSSSIIRGTIGYTAPEYGLGSEVSTSGDMYSYGILLLEMMTGKRPTDLKFQGGHDLHDFARKALPDHAMEIVEPFLLIDNEDRTTATAAASNSRTKMETRESA